jgi:hypothetical protein
MSAPLQRLHYHVGGDPDLRRNVDSDGGGLQMATSWSATAAHSAIAV